ncbi:hypothetical protein Tco_0173330 [Tanacetum coccineum]
MILDNQSYNDYVETLPSVIWHEIPISKGETYCNGHLGLVGTFLSSDVGFPWINVGLLAMLCVVSPSHAGMANTITEELLLRWLEGLLTSAVLA